MSCATGNGCNGGQPSDVWNFFVDHGVCTGGLYGDVTTCKPYPYAPCSPIAFRNITRQFPDCPNTMDPTPPCLSKCNIQGQSYTKFKAGSAYKLNGEKSIMREIYDNGPVAASFQVYSDFPTYKQGVYRRNSTIPAGGHNVKIIGWGNDGNCRAKKDAAATDDWCATECSVSACPVDLCICDKFNPGGPYWLVVNSWNTWWGDHGMFKIARGSNMCGIETGVTAGIPL
jgi:cathepsin B